MPPSGLGPVLVRRMPLQGTGRCYRSVTARGLLGGRQCISPPFEPEAFSVWSAHRPAAVARYPIKPLPGLTVVPGAHDTEAALAGLAILTPNQRLTDHKLSRKKSPGKPRSQKNPLCRR
jgi:hypothetical protein